MGLVNAIDMVQKAKAGHYAIGQFNLNNMESIRAFLLAAEETHTPVILGVSGGIEQYMGGYRAIAGAVIPFLDTLHITVPVCLHADHSTYEQALRAIDAGMSSVMFDGSKYPFEENLEKTAEVIRLAHAKGMSVEAEVGAVAGTEDGVTSSGEFADPEQCRRIAGLGVDLLAAGIGNIHGVYPADWKGLNFTLLDTIRDTIGSVPLVLHGGSGIPEDMIRQAIDRGVCKINVNTECQIAFARAVRRYIEDGKDKEGHGFNTRKLLADGVEAAKNTAIEKMTLFGCLGKA